jgi:hypothetical protein
MIIGLSGRVSLAVISVTLVSTLVVVAPGEAAPILDITYDPSGGSIRENLNGAFVVTVRNVDPARRVQISTISFQDIVFLGGDSDDRVDLQQFGAVPSTAIAGPFSQFVVSFSPALTLGVAGTGGILGLGASPVGAVPPEGFLFEHLIFTRDPTAPEPDMGLWRVGVNVLFTLEGGPQLLMSESGFGIVQVHDPQFEPNFPPLHTPIPETSTLMMFALGGGSYVLRRSRRGRRRILPTRRSV